MADDELPEEKQEEQKETKKESEESAEKIRAEVEKPAEGTGKKDISDKVDNDGGIEHELHGEPTNSEQTEYIPPIHDYEELHKPAQQSREEEYKQSGEELYKDTSEAEKSAPVSDTAEVDKSDTGTIRKPEEIRELVKTRDLLDATDFSVKKKDLVKQLKEYDNTYENKEI